MDENSFSKGVTRFRETSLPYIVAAATFGGVVVFSQGMSFAYPPDDNNYPVDYLQDHAVLLAVAGIALLFMGIAISHLIQRVSTLERQLAKQAGTQST